MDEFDFIRSRLIPLSKGADGAAGLTDDGAILDLGPGERLAVSADTLIEGRHFPVGEDPALAARKALRVNLSDLAAMGARPFAYTTSVVWPHDGFEARADGFVQGLTQDQNRFGVRLIGGDTTSSEGPWSLSFTAFGRLPFGVSLRRAGAKPGDVLAVTGPIGGAGLGLRMLKGEWSPARAEVRQELERCFRLPEPRIDAGIVARDLANAAIDVSDGLLADARQMAKASGLSLSVEMRPELFSKTVMSWLETQPDATKARLDLMSAGDDYELLLAIPPANLETLGERLANIGSDLIQFGVFGDPGRPGEVSVLDAGTKVDVPRWGFTHF